MLLTCNNCGAPLDARSAKTSIKCNYCGSVHVTESLPVQQHQVPVDWRPPQVWVAPAEFAAAGQNLTYRRTMASIQAIVMISVFAPIVLGVLGTGGAVIASSTRHGGSSPFSSWGGASSWSGSSTYKCDGNAQATVKGPSSAKLTTGVEVATNCHLVINGGTIRVTDIGVHVWDNGSLELHGAKLILDGARGSSPVAIRASNNAEIDLYDCTVEIDHGGGDALAVEADGNAKVRFHSSNVSGHYTIRAKDLALVNALGNSDVHGKVDASRGATVAGVRNVNPDVVPADGKGQANDCGCAPHDHACRHRCRKNR
jgi:hypothetical protein